MPNQSRANRQGMPCRKQTIQVICTILADSYSLISGPAVSRDIEFDLENDKIRCLSALNYHGSLIPPAVLRVTQIFEHPQFFIDGAEAIDIVQGHLGNCWFLSALATMSTSKGLINKLCVAVNHFLHHFDAFSLSYTLLA